MSTLTPQQPSRNDLVAIPRGETGDVRGCPQELVKVALGPAVLEENEVLLLLEELEPHDRSSRKQLPLSVHALDALGKHRCRPAVGQLATKSLKSTHLLVGVRPAGRLPPLRLAR